MALINILIAITIALCMMIFEPTTTIDLSNKAADSTVEMVETLTNVFSDDEIVTIKDVNETISLGTVTANAFNGIVTDSYLANCNATMEALDSNIEFGPFNSTDPGEVEDKIQDDLGSLKVLLYVLFGYIVIILPIFNNNTRSIFSVVFLYLTNKIKDLTAGSYKHNYLYASVITNYLVKRGSTLGSLLDAVESLSTSDNPLTDVDKAKIFNHFKRIFKITKKEI